MVYTNILYTSLSSREVRTSVEADEACLLNDSKLNSIFKLLIPEENVQVSFARWCDVLLWRRADVTLFRLLLISILIG